MIHDDFQRSFRPRPGGEAAARRRIRDAAAPHPETARRRVALKGGRPRRPEAGAEPAAASVAATPGDRDPAAAAAAHHSTLRRPGGVTSPRNSLTPVAAGAHTRAPAATPPPDRRTRARADAPEPAELRRPPRRRRGRPGTAGATGGAEPPARGWFLLDEPDRRTRSAWLLLAFVAMSVAVGWKLVDVQVRQAGKLGAAALRAHEGSVTITAHRGQILDANGRLLASDLSLYAIYADPGVIPQADRHDDAVALAPVLSIGTQKLDDLLNQPGDYVNLAHGVTEQQRRTISGLGIYGIIATPEDRRVYGSSGIPGTSLASNLLGYVNADGHGQYGVEGYYDSVLRGTAGTDSTVRDVNGNPIMLGSEQSTPARDGSDLRLGLDARIQNYAEQALAAAVQQSGAESGSVLVMGTTTGSIKAWADYPSYSSSGFGTADPATIKDLNIAGVYEPGSVMKVVTFAAGLDKGAITPQDQIDEHVNVIDGFRIQDWDGRQSHGRITLQWVLDDSLNNGAIAVMQKTGKDAYYTNLMKFGLGSPTGVDLAGEQNLPLRPQSTWSDVDYATASFGQQVAVTPVQMLSAINAVADGGVWVQPHAVDAVIDHTSGQETLLTPSTRRIMSPQAAATLKQMMIGSVDDKGASGYLARVPALKGQIGGKTGTASIPDNGHYGNDVIASFVGFLPLQNPQFTMLVIVRKPHVCTYDGTATGQRAPTCEGAYIAAPVFRQLSQLMVDDWKITP